MLALLIGLLLRYWRTLTRARQGAALAVGLAVLGGALSNLLDRLLRGAVVDFINLRVWPKSSTLARAYRSCGWGAPRALVRCPDLPMTPFLLPLAPATVVATPRASSVDPVAAELDRPFLQHWPAAWTVTRPAARPSTSS
ncbi:MAG: signal peptidase II [Candidatus Andersenbacteria bacterium]